MEGFEDYSVPEKLRELYEAKDYGKYGVNGTMSDVHYDPSLCRNITVDIRYVLFNIDKFAEAGYLLEEMDIVW